MESALRTKNKQQAKRKLRVRKTLRGNSIKPRMSVIKTNLHIHLQLIDDIEGRTLASISTISKGMKGTEKGKKSMESAKLLGLGMAKLALEKNIEAAIFDRGKSKYHGIIAQVAEGAREGGLKI